MLFLDAAFVAAIVLFRKLMEMLAPSLTTSAILAAPLTSLWYALSLLMVYYLLVLLLYSFVKHLVLHYVRSLFTPSQLSFSRFWGFYGLNVSLLMVFGTVFSFLAYFLAAVRQSYAPLVLLVLGIPSFLILFICMNAAHSFYHSFGEGAFRALGRAFSFTFTEIRLYGKMIGTSVLFLAVLWLLLYLIGLGIKSVATSNYQLYTSLYSFFVQASSILGPVLLYFLLLFNRLGFYAMIMAERKGEREE